MLFNIESTLLRDGGFKVNNGKKDVTVYAIAEINYENAISEVNRTSLFKNLVAYRFNGGIEQLKIVSEIVNKGNKPILYDIKVDTIDEGLMMKIHQLPSEVVPVVHLPKEYSNLYDMHLLCEKVPRVRIEGGDVLRLQGLNLGSVTTEDIPKKINESTLPVRINYEDGNSPMKTIKVGVEEIIFYESTMREVLTEEEKEMRRQAKKVSRVKKAKPKKEVVVKPKSKPKAKVTSALDFFK